MKKVLMLVGDFVEDYEAMVLFQGLQALGFAVDAACPEKEAGDKVKTAIHDFDGDQTYSEKPGHLFALTVSFSEVKEADYDALMLPGGRAPEYLRLDDRVLELVRQFADRKKVIGSVCHGPQLLTAAGVIAGKKISAYPAVRPEITLAGGIYADLDFHEAITDDNFVSAPAWTAHVELLKQFTVRLNLE